MRKDLARKIAAHIRMDGKEATGVPGLSLYRKSAPTQSLPRPTSPS